MPNTSNRKTTRSNTATVSVDYCNKCGTYHDVPVGLECTVFGKNSSKPPSKGSPSASNPPLSQDPGFKMLMASVASMASSMDQLLKNQFAEKPDTSSRRRSTSEPPNRRGGDLENPDPDRQKQDPILPKPADLAKTQLSQALIDLLPGITAAPTKAKKSGENRSASDRVVKDVVWPNEKIRAESGKPLDADNITQSQWTRGFVELIKDAPTADQGHMLHFLSEAMLDVERSDWETVRKFNKRVFHCLEADQFNWADRDIINMERLRFLYAASNLSKSHNTSQQKGQKSPDVLKPTLESTPCAAYNDGKCLISSMFHDNLWHICVFCKSVRGKAVVGHGTHNCRQKEHLEQTALSAPSLLAAFQHKV